MPRPNQSRKGADAQEQRTRLRRAFAQAQGTMTSLTRILREIRGIHSNPFRPERIGADSLIQGDFHETRQRFQPCLLVTRLAQFGGA